jgi:ubiquinone/menaquinone biosynthesis C-methylase UbiE
VSAPRFFPGAINYDNVSARYRLGRTLAAHAAETWQTEVGRFVQRSPSPRIVDLGAGTGRFAVLFARSFASTVIGIEPSRGMLAVAAAEERPHNLAYLAGIAEHLPLADETCDIAWVSHVWHHIKDHQSCANELHRVLRPGGHLLVRGTFGDWLDGYPTMFQYWPAARAICAQVPTVADTVRVLEAQGFSLLEHRRVRQETAPSLAEFARRTRSRSDSALMLISDAEFRDGQAAIEAAVASQPESRPVIEIIELLAFTR